MQNVLILGAGGHATVVADILMRARDAGERINPIGYLDESMEAQGDNLLGLPVLGKIADLEHISHDAIIVAIGDNETQRRIFDQLQRQGERFAMVRHPGAVIALDVRIGAGTVICAGVVVNPGSAIGTNVILNTDSAIDHHNRISNHAHVAPGVHLGGNVQIGEGALVGIGASVLPNCQIGAWSVVGAGAVVLRDIPDGAVAVSVPARVIKYHKRPL